MEALRRRTLRHIVGVAMLVAAGLSSASPPASATTTNYTAFGSATPATVDSGDTANTEVGMNFQVSQGGVVTAIRFYKAVANTGVHVGYLKNQYQTIITTVTFTNETASGWQQAQLSSPVTLIAGDYYDVTYTAPNGHYSLTAAQFASGFDSSPFHVKESVFSYSGNPSDGNLSVSYANYFVDVVFQVSSDSTDITMNIEPAFTFSVGNRATSCNGEASFASSAGSSSGVGLGHLSPGSAASGAQALQVSTNAGSGFTVYVRGALPSQNLRGGGRNWTDGGGSYGAASALGTGERFGYTFHDFTASTTASNPANANYIALTNATNNAVMRANSGATGSACVAFTAQSGLSTPPGNYSGVIIYTAVPAF